MRVPSVVMNASEDLYDFSDDEDYYPAYVDVSDRWQALAEASAVLAFCFTTTAATLAAIASLSVGKFQVLDLYLLSLCAADLLSSTAVIPLSLAAKSGLLAGDGHSACAVSGYLHISLCAVRMYTLMWASVDRYLAIRKPHRYDGIQTRARCQCWVLFSWVTATCLCCPPLLGDSRGHFYHEGFLCLLDVGSMLPYSVTLGCLVLIPSVLTILYTYTYIFTTADSSDCAKEDQERKSSDYITTLLVTIEYVVLWLPWGIVSIFENTSGRSVVGSTVRFWLLFLRESSIVWSPITLLVMCRSCRDGFTTLCTKSSSDSEISL